MAHFTMTDGSAAPVCNYSEAAFYAGFHFHHIARYVAAVDSAAYKRRMGSPATGRRPPRLPDTSRLLP